MTAAPVSGEPARAAARGKDPRSGVVAILAALPEELSGIPRRLEQVEAQRVGGLKATSGLLANRPVVFAATGDGAARAARNAAAILDQVSPTRLVILGVAGGLSPGLHPGDLVVARRVVDLGDNTPVPQPDPDWQERALASGATPALVVSSPRILVRAEDKALAYAALRTSSVAAADLETAALAREAARRGIPYLALRAISDPAEETLPMDFERLRDREGGVSRPRVLLHALARPGLIRSLVMLSKRLSTCAERLAGALPAIVGANP
jgi:adenosylhomocysteine nucleosidase